MGDFAAEFDRFFTIVRATSEEDIREAQRLRYQVYCVEHPFEDPALQTDGLERDPYDNRSAHSYLRHHDKGIVAATVRLILASALEPAEALPIELHGGAAFLEATEEMALPRAHIAEISRFAVSKEFKQRLGEARLVDGLHENSLAHRQESERRVLPHLTVGLFKAIVQMSAECGVRYWYAVMEPRLLRLLRGFGIRFRPIGPIVDYHGQRQPCLGVAGEVLENMRRERPDVWEFITDAGQLWPPAEAAR